MKGQVSLEAILLMLFQVVSLALVVGVAFVLINATDKALERYNYLKEHGWLKEVVREVCILGNGQVRPVRLRYNHTVTTECGTVFIEQGNRTIRNVLGMIIVS